MYEHEPEVLNYVLKELRDNYQAKNTFQILINKYPNTTLQISILVQQKLEEDKNIKLDKENKIISIPSITLLGKTFLMKGGYEADLQPLFSSSNFKANFKSQSELTELATKLINKSQLQFNESKPNDSFTLTTDLLNKLKKELEVLSNPLAYQLRPLANRLINILEKEFGNEDRLYLKLKSKSKYFKHKLLEYVEEALVQLEYKQIQNKKSTKTNDLIPVQKNNTILSIKKLNDLLIEIKQKSFHLNSTLDTFRRRLVTILEKELGVKHELIDRLKNKMLVINDDVENFVKEALEILEYNASENQTELSNLHPIVLEVSEQQFLDKHYREAVSNSIVKLIETIKNDYPIEDKNGKLKDGVDLMQEVFSSDNPKFRFSGDVGEQKGMMFLYAGAVAGLRNKYAHKTSKIENKQYALELLHFISALFRLYENKNIF